MSRKEPDQHRPETVEAARSRFCMAVDHVLDLDKIDFAAGPADENVFDFEDGIRVIVGVEYHGGNTVEVHVSSSFAKGFQVYDDIEAKRISYTKAVAKGLARCQQICPYSFPASWVVMQTKAGHVHFFAPVPKDWPTRKGARNRAESN